MSTHQPHSDEPLSPAIRLGIYDSVGPARAAINKLLDAGFSRDQISVICSDDAKERTFRDFDHQHGNNAGDFSPANVGSTIGSTLGGMVVVATAFASGGVPLLASEGPAAWTGGLAGGFIGSLVGRGVQEELAHFYDHAVTQGKLLVAVEDRGEQAAEQLAAATRIFTETGAETVSTNSTVSDD